MSAEIPYARVLAETAAWPLGSLCAFRQGLTHLGRHEGGTLTERTKVTAHALEDNLRLRAGGASLETLRHVRDHVWFGPVPGVGDRPLADMLRHLALLYFEKEGGNLHLKRTWAIDGVQKRLESYELAHRLRYLTLALPLDLLAAALETECPAPAFLYPSDAPIQQAFETLLGEGTTELHCHLGACLRFEALWTYVMATTGGVRNGGERTDAEEECMAADAGPFGDPGTLVNWLATSGLARLTLAEYLAHRGGSNSSSAESFGVFMGHFLRGEPPDQRDHRRTLSELAKGTQPAPAQLVRALYRRYADMHSLGGELRTLKCLLKSDPLAEMLAIKDGVGWPESHFTCRALQYLQGFGRNDLVFSQIFWQYQRIRCITYRYLTEEPGTSGLDWFVRFFHRVAPLRRGLDERVLIDSAVQIHQGQAFPGKSRRAARLDTLEVRISPKGSDNKFREFLCKVRDRSETEEHGKIPSDIKFGVIVHFNKVGLDTSTTIVRPGRDSGNGLIFSRYGARYRKWRRQMSTIKRVLSQEPFFLRTLRGLDICGQELSTPLWPLLPLLGELRQAARDLASEQAGQPSMQLPRFGITLHAGEEFRTPLEGLRRIHEPIEFHLLERKDRIGHAIALGINVSEWSRVSPVAWQPTEERIDDLLWLFDRAPQLESRPSTRLMDLLEGEVYARGCFMYGNDLLRSIDREAALAALREARMLRHAPEILRRWNYPNMDRVPPSLSLSERLLHLYLTDLSVFRRGSAPVEVVTSEEETKFVENAQLFLREVFSSMQLTVEANPSSNLLVAELGALDRHPMFRLCPVSHVKTAVVSYGSGQIASQITHRLRRLWKQLQGTLCPSSRMPRVRVALSTDDPITFATSLPEEIAYTYHALVRQGCPADVALEWLRDRLKDSRDGLFTIDDVSSLGP